jgi:hypothetical protein
VKEKAMTTIIPTEREPTAIECLTQCLWISTAMVNHYVTTDSEEVRQALRIEIFNALDATRALAQKALSPE